MCYIACNTKLALMKKSFLSLWSLSLLALNAQNFHEIPTSEVNLQEHYNAQKLNGNCLQQSVSAFNISEAVSWKDYKAFLLDIKAFQGNYRYQQLLPQLSETLLDEILNQTQHDTEPVAGITWHQARYYAQWKTIEDQKEGFFYQYRLPTIAEYYAAMNNQAPISTSYSYWTLNSVQDYKINPCGFGDYTTKESQKEDGYRAVVGKSLSYNPKNDWENHSLFHQDKSFPFIGLVLVKDAGRALDETPYSYFGPVYYEHILAQYQISPPQSEIIRNDEYSLAYSRLNNQFHHTFNLSFKASQLKARGTYLNGHKIGEWKYLDENNNLIFSKKYTSPISYRAATNNTPVQDILNQTSYHSALNPKGFHEMDIDESTIIYSKRIWSYLTPEENPLIDQDQRLFKRLAQLIENEKIAVYSNNDDEFKTTISKEDWMKLLPQNYTVLRYEIKKDYFFDKLQLQMREAIVGIRPILQNAKGAEIEMGWLYFPWLKPFLAEMPLYTEHESSYYQSEAIKTMNSYSPFAPSIEDYFYFQNYQDHWSYESGFKGKQKIKDEVSSLIELKKTEELLLLAILK